MKVQELLLRELQLPKGKVLRLLEPFLFQSRSCLAQFYLVGDLLGPDKLVAEDARRASSKGFLNLSFNFYLDLLD